MNSWGSKIIACYEFRILSKFKPMYQGELTVSVDVLRPREGEPAQRTPEAAAQRVIRAGRNIHGRTERLTLDDIELLGVMHYRRNQIDFLS